jgi:hypothetical protein
MDDHSHIIGSKTEIDSDLRLGNKGINSDLRLGNKGINSDLR